MNLVSSKFKSQAILRGGMALYLLNSKRYTNDLDYAFVPYKSKNDILKPLLSCLDEVENLKYTYSLNSKCLRIIVEYENFKCQLEVKVFKELESIPIVVDSYINKTIPDFVVRIANLEWALSNKIAAWVERRLARDLYDIYFINSILGINPDFLTLRKRLQKIEYSKNIENSSSKLTIKEFVDFLEKAMTGINQDLLRNELRDYFSEKDLYGLDLKIINSLG